MTNGKITRETGIENVTREVKRLGLILRMTKIRYPYAALTCNTSREKKGVQTVRNMETHNTVGTNGSEKV